ncbi:MAG: GNAT family N-acetyltransferase [Planctomycetota bacterium]|nr:MAG: GNAT family N-acetyltransferase [Planctomycetota bacterium]
MEQDSSHVNFQDIPNDTMQIILPLIQQLNPDTSQETLAHRLSEMQSLNYHTLGAFNEEKLIGIASYWFGTRFWCGKYVDIDNVIIEESYRGQGIAENMINQIEVIAKKSDCEISILDSYTSNHKSNRFYHKMKYHVEGFHFVKYMDD